MQLIASLLTLVAVLIVALAPEIQAHSASPRQPLLTLCGARKPIGPCQPYAEICPTCSDCSQCGHCKGKGGKCSVCWNG